MALDYNNASNYEIIFNHNITMTTNPISTSKACPLVAGNPFIIPVHKIVDKYHLYFNYYSAFVDMTTATATGSADQTKMYLDWHVFIYGYML